jgi:putative transposase
MSKKKALHSPTLKAKVALAALKGDRTISQVAAAFQVHPNQIYKWRRQLLDLAPTLFESSHEVKDTAQAAAAAALYEQIGRLQVELDWLKKKHLNYTAAQLRQRIDPEDSRLSVRRQCDLLGLPRSTLYYRPVPESAANLALMRRIDEQYLRTPFFGSRRRAAWLQRPGEAVNRKRVQRRMGLMGLQVV